MCACGKQIYNFKYSEAFDHIYKLFLLSLANICQVSLWSLHSASHSFAIFILVGRVRRASPSTGTSRLGSQLRSQESSHHLCLEESTESASPRRFLALATTLETFTVESLTTDKCSRFILQESKGGDGPLMSMFYSGVRGIISSEAKVVYHE